MDFFVNFVIIICYLDLFYALIKKLEKNIKVNINICLFYLKEKHI